MFRGETPAPLRQPSPPGDERCEAAKESVAVLLSSGNTLADDPSLREHLKACADCNSLYRELLLADSRLRRTLVECESQVDSGADETAPVRRAILSPLAVARAGFGSPGRGKTTWVVMLAIICYAVIRLTPDPSGTARAQLIALEGLVQTVGEPLAVGEPARELQRGDWVRTPEGARARLTLGTTTVEVAAASVVQVEEPSTLRLRLESGALDINGPLIITSRFGIVEVEAGHANLSLDSSGLSVESTHGSVRTIDSQGERDLAAGERAQLAWVR